MAKKQVQRLDPLSKSEQMSRVRSRGTQPELLVRSLLSGAGVRYRLHKKDMPGRPDLYVGRLHLAIFINGCFWHGHGCRRAGQVHTNVAFWAAKIRQNAARDSDALNRLEKMGILALTLWTCEAESFRSVCSRVARAYEAQG